MYWQLFSKTERERGRKRERERGRAIQLPGRSSLHVVIRKSQPQVFSSAFCLSMEFPMLLLHLSHCDTTHTHTHTYCVRVCVCERERDCVALSLSLACACRRRRRSVGFQQRRCNVQRSTCHENPHALFIVAHSSGLLFHLDCWKTHLFSPSLSLSLSLSVFWPA